MLNEVNAGVPTGGEIEMALDGGRLARQLGAADELTAVGPALGAPGGIRTEAELREFLRGHREEALGGREFAVICEAQACASRGFLQELLALDRRLAGEGQRTPLEGELAKASRAVGRRQLNRLRDLRDLRLAQRYREAVNAGQAHGWHTVVYGLVLAAYSLPLRQGLLHYGRQTLNGFIRPAARALRLTEEAQRALEAEEQAALLPLIEAALRRAMETPSPDARVLAAAFGESAESTER